jgi:hypothetical protein
VFASVSHIALFEIAEGGESGLDAKNKVTKRSGRNRDASVETIILMSLFNKIVSRFNMDRFSITNFSFRNVFFILSRNILVFRAKQKGSPEKQTSLLF